MHLPEWSHSAKAGSLSVVPDGIAHALFQRRVEQVVLTHVQVGHRSFWQRRSEGLPGIHANVEVLPDLQCALSSQQLLLQADHADGLFQGLRIEARSPL